MDVQFFESSSALHQWFLENHEDASELWVGIYRKETGRPTVSWEEVRDELLCFGWSEGMVQQFDELAYAIRLTPRKPKSKWSLKNVEKALVLMEMGLMEPSGIRAFEDRDLKYEEEQRTRAKIEGLEGHYLTAFKKHPLAYHYFEQEAPSYRKAASRWVMTAKQEATRLRRLEVLIEFSKEGQRIPSLRPRKK